MSGVLIIIQIRYVWFSRVQFAYMYIKYLYFSDLIFLGYDFGNLEKIHALVRSTAWKSSVYSNK